jgi:hypothetical protein
VDERDSTQNTTRTLTILYNSVLDLILEGHLVYPCGYEKNEKSSIYVAVDSHCCCNHHRRGVLAYPGCTPGRADIMNGWATLGA